MVVSRRDFSKPRKICNRNLKDIWDDRLQVYDYSDDYSDDNKFETIE